MSDIEKEIRDILYSAKNYNDKSIPDSSIMVYERVCFHNDGWMCKCRVDYLINFLKDKKLIN